MEKETMDETPSAEECDRVSAGCTSGKRKRQTLSITSKVELLQKLESGASVRSLCQLYNVGASTVYDIKQQKEQLLRYFADSGSKRQMSVKKTMRVGKCPELDKALIKWYRQRQSEGVDVTPTMLREQAMILHDQLGVEYECNYSSGWLQRFKQRHGLIKPRSATATVHNSGDEETVDRLLEFAKFVSDEKQMLATDETFIFSSTTTSSSTCQQDSKNRTKSIDTTKNSSGVKKRKKPILRSKKHRTNSRGSDRNEMGVPIGRLIQLCNELINGLEECSCISEQEIMNVYMLEDKLIKERIKELQKCETSSVIKAEQLDSGS